MANVVVNIAGRPYTMQCPDGEEDHQVADEPLHRVGLTDRVVQAAGGLRDGDHEDEIEEELEPGHLATRLAGGNFILRNASASEATAETGVSTRLLCIAA